MNILIDMNLSPSWVEVLEKGGHKAKHWQSIGTGTEADKEIMTWASDHNYLVFTHDLDFSHILAATKAEGPSVIQVRGEDVLPAAISSQVLKALDQFEEELIKGALVSIDSHNARIRILPL